MPRGHYKMAIRNISEIEQLKIREVYRVIPKGALVSPSHHEEAVRFDEPLTHQSSPLTRNWLFNNDDRAKGSCAIIWRQRIPWLDAEITQALQPPNAQAQRSAAWMPYSEGTLSFRLRPSLLSEATAAGALQLVVRGPRIFQRCACHRDCASEQCIRKGLCDGMVER